MDLFAIIENRVLVIALVAWILAQILKIPLDYFITRKWDWSTLLSSGGMPSSHSALLTAATTSIGMYKGFDTPLFGLAFVVTMIVTYDAAGIRRQAGIHAQKINTLMKELFTGHPVSEKVLREVLGHTPLEVAGGILLGVFVALSFWLLWQ